MKFVVGFLGLHQVEPTKIKNISEHNNNLNISTNIQQFKHGERERRKRVLKLRRNKRDRSGLYR